MTKRKKKKRKTKKRRAKRRAKKRFKKSKKKSFKRKNLSKKKSPKEAKDGDGNYVFKVSENWSKQAYVNNVYEKCLILLIENGCLPLYTILKDKKFMLNDMTERLKFLLETLRSRQTNSQAM